MYRAWHAAMDVSKKKVLEPDFKTDQLASVIQNMALLTLNHDPLVARYEIVGSALVRLLGSDPTGKEIAQVYPRSIGKEVYAALAAVSDDKTLRYTVREFRVLMHHYGYRRLILPLYHPQDAAHPSRAIIGIYPTDRGLTNAFQWKRGVKKAEKIVQALDQNAQTAWVRSLKREKFKPLDDAQEPSKGDFFLVD